MKEKPPFPQLDLQKEFFEKLASRYKTLDQIFQSFSIKEFNNNVLPLIKSLFQSEIENLYKGLQGLDEIISPETKKEMETALREKIEQLLKKLDELIQFLKTDLKHQIGVIKDIYDFLGRKIEEEINLIIAKQHYPRLTKEELEMIRLQVIIGKILKILTASTADPRLKDYKDIFEIFKNYFQAVSEKKEIATNLQTILWLTLFMSILKIKFAIDPTNLI